MTETTAAPRARKSRAGWLTGLLIVSLALNALALGTVLRAAWRVGMGQAGPGVPEARLPAFLATLTNERRQSLRTPSLRDRPKLLRPLREEVHRAREAWSKAIAAEPFDAKAFAEAQEAVLDAEIKLRRAAQSSLLDVVERMTPEERRAFTRWRPQRGPGNQGNGQRRAPGIGEEKSGDRQTDHQKVEP